MSLQIKKNCLYYNLIAAFMLFYQSAHSQDFKAVDRWLEDHTEEMGGRSTLMILKDGKIVYSNSVNDMNRKQKFVTKMVAKKTNRSVEEMQADFSPDHKILIASCSKWLSAALVMTFVDEGKLKLDDTVGKFLPALSASGKGKITIANCLSHMTGVKSGTLKESRKGFEDSKTMDEAMQKIAEMPMESAPGESFHYSSVGLQITAAIIEKISGKDFRTLFAERIARPLEMMHTDFGNAAIPIPAGSGSSTAADYLRFLEMILNNGTYKGKTILKKETVALMQHNYSAGKQVIYTPVEAGSWGYGFGEWIPNQKDAAVRSEWVTSPGLFGSFPYVDNEHHYAAVLFTFYIKNKGRNDRYSELKRTIDAALAN